MVAPSPRQASNETLQYKTSAPPARPPFSSFLSSWFRAFFFLYWYIHTREPGPPLPPPFFSPCAIFFPSLFFVAMFLFPAGQAGRQGAYQ